MWDDNCALGSSLPNPKRAAMERRRRLRLAGVVGGWAFDMVVAVMAVVWCTQAAPSKIYLSTLVFEGTHRQHHDENHPNNGQLVVVVDLFSFDGQALSEIFSHFFNPKKGGMRQRVRPIFMILVISSDAKNH